MGTLRIGAEQFRRELTELLNRVGYGGDEVIVERNGRPIAVLKPYANREEAIASPEDAVEQVPVLAAQIAAAREEAGIAYEDLARQLQAERLRTLREKYPDFTAEFAPDEASKPA
ncbi:MAG: type II toxin-antitoxin system prevent-host-death family antitoxin [Anaerolineae bacterium]